ncbi:MULTISPECIES: hypothetical protein [unclassified Synechococcus]|uniref:hypothetical protein n=1 Tax=unclassified Synechococcus TaxID=2626047 RepID=UPI000B99B840|nr:MULTISPECIES: hypothetical protein [unclassified Synechococcus]
MTNPAALGSAPSPARPAAVLAAADKSAAATPPGPAADPVLCHHCGRTASNGISCQGICVADSGY